MQDSPAYEPIDERLELGAPDHKVRKPQRAQAPDNLCGDEQKYRPPDAELPGHEGQVTASLSPPLEPDLPAA